MTTPEPRPPLPSYRGTESYVFVSYSHRDAREVYAELEWLHGEGARLWYDEGIEAGENWHAELAQAIRNAELFLFFVSPRSVDSPHCQRELNFALSTDRPVLAVHLEPTELPDGIQFSIGDRQAILRSNFAVARYREKLLAALSERLAGAGAVEPAAPAAARAGNLPQRSGRLIGRDDDLARACDMLEAHRLTTLVGTGGAGKTRLAIETGREMAGLMRDGAWVIALASLESGDLVPNQVAAALGVTEIAGKALDETLLDHLRPREALLVLDNCEHVVDAAAELVSSVLAACPRVHILATSREPLQVSGEYLQQVQPLSAEVTEHGPPPAAELFAERARAVQSDFELGPDNIDNVLKICARLEGIPLAIELAAARCAVMSVADMARRLQESFRALGRGPRDSVRHHQTLRATLDWSYRLLDEFEQALLRRLSVFRGGFALAAAEAVCGAEAVDAYDVVDLLDRLVSKSLVQTQASGEHLRFSLLETIRDFAAEKLVEEGRQEALAGRHRDHFLSLAETASHAIQLDPARWVAELDADQANFRAALRHSIDNGEGDEALRLVGSLAYYWVLSGGATEKRTWFEQALEFVDSAHAQSRGTALLGAGMAAGLDADYTAAEGLLGRAREAFEELGFEPGIAWVSFWQGRNETAKVFSGVAGEERLEPARGHYQQALAWFEANGDGAGTALTLAFSAWAAKLGRSPDAMSLIERAIEAARGARLERGEMVSRAHKAHLLAERGELDTALAMLDECVGGLSRIGDQLNRQICICLAGLLSLASGRDDDALVHARDAVAGSEGLRAREWEPLRLALALFVLDRNDEDEAAARLCAVLDRMLATWPLCIRNCGLDDASQRRQRLLARIDPEVLDAQTEQGHTMTIGDAITFARRTLAKVAG